MRPFGFTLTRAMLLAMTTVCVLLVACGQDMGKAPPGSGEQTVSPLPEDRTSASGEQTGKGPHLLVQTGKNDQQVPDVEGKPVEAACRALSRAGHVGEVSYIRRVEGTEPGLVLAQDIEPGTNKGTSMLVYLTVSGPFSEKELSANTYCANPQPDIDDAPPRGSRH